MQANRNFSRRSFDFFNPRPILTLWFFFSGGLIYLLDLYANGTNPVVRERSAELFSKMMSDKLIGPKVKIVLSKFLPAIFMDAMRDNASASVHMFEGEARRSLS